jgi:hypothetical protein
MKIPPGPLQKRGEELPFALTSRFDEGELRGIFTAKCRHPIAWDGGLIPEPP